MTLIFTNTYSSLFWVKLISNQTLVIMERYVVNRLAQTNGDHEVHKQGCRYFPLSYIELGMHSSCRSAVIAAKGYYWKSDGCKFCIPECHSR